MAKEGIGTDRRRHREVDAKIDTYGEHRGDIGEQKGGERGRRGEGEGEGEGER